MNITASIIGVRLIFSIFMALVPMALLVALQVWLCRKGKWLGLILPGLSLLVSLLLVFGVSAINGAVGRGSVTVTDDTGRVIEQYDVEPEQSGLTPGAVGAIVGVFLVGNIPTVVFGGIWLHYKNRRDFQNDLKKMKIEDLE